MTFWHVTKDLLLFNCNIGLHPNCIISYHVKQYINECTKIQPHILCSYMEYCNSKWLDIFSSTVCNVAKYLLDNNCMSLLCFLMPSYGIWKTLDGRMFSTSSPSSNSCPFLSHLKYFSCKGKHGNNVINVRP